MSRRKADRAGLEARIGHSFGDSGLLERALTHVSAATGEGGLSNQRLEFLGDRVLGLAVADMLHGVLPAATEGELSHRLSELVRRETCAAIASEWDIASHLVLGPGATRAAGRSNAAILADAAEAVIGAVFLDAGYPTARAVVERAVAGRIDAAQRPRRDPKTALQEWAQAAGRATPVYEVAERSGPDHAPRFRVVAEVTGLASATGTGASKRAAEQDAALALLTREGVWSESGDARP